MNFEETLLQLSDNNLKSESNDHLQTILNTQTQSIQFKKENLTPKLVLQKLSIQKKLDVLEKNILKQDVILSSRRSKNRLHTNMNSLNENEIQQRLIFTNPNMTDQSILKKQKKELQTQITSIEFKQRENYLQNQNRIKQIQQDKESLIEKNQNLNEQQQKLNQRQQALQLKQFNLEQQEKQIQYQILCLKENEQEQLKHDEFLNKRRENMEELQIKLNESVSQLLNLANSKNKVQNQLTIQFEAIQFLIKYIIKEKQALESEQLYLQKFKQDVLNEKKQVLQVKDQII
ncbi:unnamed protein product [Paramecium sonneborni]|uniref:Uncharacterized protein n=1 Tax=Paramecium sonneborni TaxID=65129 RepID=A0A8S1QZQ3_9CILI|nr:unnamed protein product [Paramecium sonneborni]